MTEDLATVTAAILAGGLGTRLRPVLQGRPKVLAEVAGRPFLGFLLDQLAGAGIRKVVLCTGFRGDEVRGLLGSTHAGMAVVYSQEPAPAGTAGALWQAAGLLDSDPVLVLNGDSYLHLDLAALLDWHRARRAQATLVLVESADPGRYGRVVAREADGQVMSFEEKPDRDGVAGSVATAWISAGIYLLGRPVLDWIHRQRPASLERDVFPAWVGRGLFGFPCRAPFIDIGTPATYAAAPAFFAALAEGDRP